MGEIYEPSDDSFFFSDFLEDYFKKLKSKKLKYLDMGTGSGILARTVNKFLPKEDILVADCNPDAIKLNKKNGFNAIKTDLFSKIDSSFDLITFNTPYLPLDENEPNASRLATTGGIMGDEVTVKFLKQAKRHLNKNGQIYILVSSLTPMEEIKKFGPKTVAKKKIFMEELLILKIK